jgi:hypothetical protein
MNMSKTRTAFAVVSAALLLAACGGGGTTGGDQSQDPAASEAPAVGGELQFFGTEYAFSVEESAPAGETEVTLVNQGEEPHMLDLVPITEDAPPVEELIRLPEKKVEKFFEGPPIHFPPVKPGETSKTKTVELRAGRYGYVCFFAKKGEKPHAFQGMFGELTVE